MGNLLIVVIRLPNIQPPLCAISFQMAWREGSIQKRTTNWTKSGVGGKKNSNSHTIPIYPLYFPLPTSDHSYQ